MTEEAIKQLKEAIERQRLIPPRERFQAMVRRGAIDKDGNVLLRRPTDQDCERELSQTTTGVKN